jgi:hypothetical protein
MALNRYAVIENLWDALFSVQSILYEKISGYLFFSELILYIISFPV